MKKTIRKERQEKEAGKERIYQDMQRKKNKFARVLKAGKPTERSKTIDKMTNWQKSQMMRSCKGDLNSLTDEQVTYYASLKKTA